MSGAALAAGGNTEEHRKAYQDVCRRMLQRFGESKDMWAAERTANVCLFRPDGPGDRKKLLALAQTAHAGDPKTPWNVLALALAHTRAGQPEKAVKLVQEYLLAYPPGYGEPYEITLTLVLGIAQARLGQADEAREELSGGLKRLAQAYPPGSKQLRPPGHGWVQCHALRREAEELLKHKP
jgi:hypothetical protein